MLSQGFLMPCLSVNVLISLEPSRRWLVQMGPFSAPHAFNCGHPLVVWSGWWASHQEEQPEVATQATCSSPHAYGINDGEAKDRVEMHVETTTEVPLRLPHTMNLFRLAN